MIINIGRNGQRLCTLLRHVSGRKVIKQTSQLAVKNFNHHFTFQQTWRSYHDIFPNSNEFEADIVPFWSPCDEIQRELESTASAEKRATRFKESVQEYFELSEEEYKTIDTNFPSLYKKYYYATIKYLCSIGLNKYTFIRYPWLVSEESDELEAKIAAIAKAYPDLKDINICAPLMNLSIPRLNELLERWKVEAVNFEFPSKFHYMAHALEVPMAVILENVGEKFFLITLTYPRIQDGIKLLLGSGISKAQMLSDLWVLRYSPQILKARIDAVHQAGVPIKPWLLRCTRTIFETNVEEHIKFKECMGTHPDLNSYLAERLECTMDDIHVMLKGYPSIKKVGAWKMKSVLDFLLGKGVLPIQIMLSPRILAHNLPMVQDRVSMMEDRGIPISSLAPLYCPRQKFEEMLEKNKKHIT